MKNCSENKDIKITEFAPVVLFCYTRLDCLKVTVEALKNNAEAKETPLFVYSDAGKDEVSQKQVDTVRQYLRTITGFQSVTIIEQQENKKLEYNVIQGVTEVVNRFGKVIVLEDDILVSKYFLSFMNRSLEFYKDRKEVMEISGFGYPDLKLYEKLPETFAWRMEGGWGWGTWQDRWKHFQHFKSKQEALSLLSQQDLYELEFQGQWKCLNLLNLSPIPWDICWYIAIYLNKGVTISPSRTHTLHIGYEGTHFANGKSLVLKYDSFEKIGESADIELIDNTERSLYAEHVIARYLRLNGNIFFPKSWFMEIKYFIKKYFPEKWILQLKKITVMLQKVLSPPEKNK